MSAEPLTPLTAYDITSDLDGEKPLLYWVGEVDPLLAAKNAEIERLERDKEYWAQAAAGRNVRIALIAEERDRLRNALTEIAGMYDRYSGDDLMPYRMNEVAEAALKGPAPDVGCRHTDILNNKCQQCGETRTAAGWLSDTRNCDGNG